MAILTARRRRARLLREHAADSMALRPARPLAALGQGLVLSGPALLGPLHEREHHRQRHGDSRPDQAPGVDVPAHGRPPSESARARPGLDRRIQEHLPLGQVEHPLAEVYRQSLRRERVQRAGKRGASSRSCRAAGLRSSMPLDLGPLGRGQLAVQLGAQEFTFG